MQNKIEKLLWLRLIIGILFTLGGISTVVLAIIKFVDNTQDNLPSRILTLSIGVLLIICGVCQIIIGLIKRYKKTEEEETKEVTKSKDKTLAAVVIGGCLVISIGAFFLFDEVDSILEYFIQILLPLMIIGFGGSLVVLSIIYIITKKPIKSILTPLIAGLIILAAGICFLIFRKEVENVLWIILGIIITIAGISAIVLYFKEVKKKHEKNVKKKEEETETKEEEEKESKEENKSEEEKKEENK